MTNTLVSLPTPVGASTADLGPNIRIIPAYSIIEKALVTTTTDEALAHAQAMRELAALSLDSGSLERGLEDEMNRSAWGIHGA